MAAIKTINGLSIAGTGIDSYTKLLMHCDGSGQTFVDSSLAPHTLTATGAVITQSATQSKFGGKSLYNNATANNYVYAADSDDWDFGTADFTVDFWVYFNSVGTLYFLGNSSWLTSGWVIYWDSNNLYINGGATGRSNVWTPTTDVWYHVAVTRVSSIIQMYINGTAIGNGTQVIADNIVSVNELFIGRDHDGAQYLNGYMDEIRISKGIARWTANFTPPTAAYSPPAIKTINGLNMAAGAGVWSAGGNLAVARAGLAGCGTQTAGLSFGAEGFATTEEYNGTSWSAGGNLATGRGELGGCGTQTAGLSFAGANGATYYGNTEEYDGTSWSAGGDLTASFCLAGCGTQTAGLRFGGYNYYMGGALVITEEYNGTSWSAGGNLAVTQWLLGGCGTQTAGLCFGSYVSNQNVTEEYDGTSWSAGGNLATGRSFLAGCGTQTAGLSFGAYETPSTVTEEYNGTSWSAGGNLAVGRYSLAGCGTQTAGLSFGGTAAATSAVTAVTEEYNIPQPAIKTVNGLAV